MKRTKRRGHGVGKDAVSISTSIPISVDAELRKLAAASELTRGGYARTKLRSGKIVEYPLDHPENPTARAADDAAV